MIPITILVISIVVLTFPLPVLLGLRGFVELIVLFATLRHCPSVVSDAVTVELASTKVFSPCPGKTILLLESSS